MGTQHLSLKWNSHQKNMLDVFEQLLWNEDLVDVTLACEGTTLKAHKTVLSACSSFFHNLFSEYPDKHPIVIMKDMKFSDLKIIVDFMYRGEVIVAHDQLGELLKTADTLKIKGLSESVTDGTYGSEEIFKEQEEISSHSFNTSLSLAPTASLTSMAEQTQCQSSSPVQKRRKRIRQRKRSSSISSDDQVPSNKLAAETDFIEIIEDESTTLKSNNASSDVSQSEISTFHSSINVQNICDIVGPGPLQDSDVNADIPSLRTVDTVEKSRILDHQTSDKNLRIVPETEFIIPTVPLPEITPLQLVPSHSSPCSVPSEVPAATHTLQESNKDIKPVALVSFEEQPLTLEVGLSSHESSLSVSSIKIEETSSSIPSVHVTQQSEQRNLQDICASTSGYSRVTDYPYVRETIAPTEKKSQLPNLEYINLFMAEKVLNDHSAKKCKAKIQQHVCNICSKAFSQRSYLVTHYRTHTGERPFSCDQCGKRYRQTAHLYTHKMIHSGEKRFTCSQCGKKFTRLRHLRMHSMIHSKKKHFS